MSSTQNFTNDLRSEAKEFKRDKDHRAKWAFGTEFGRSRRIEDNKPRPVRLRPAPSCVSDLVHKQRHSVKNKYDIAYQSGDSSADEDIEPASVAPVPDAEITYSYDADRGPSHGSQILSLALAEAIEKYEVRQTDKLIKEEYEVLGYEDETGGLSTKAIAVDGEDYELVNA